MLFLILFCVTSLSRLPGGWTLDSDLHQDINNMRDEIQLRNIVMDIVKEEVDDARANIASGLQQKLDLQDKRIHVLERELQKRNKVIERLLSKLDIVDRSVNDAGETLAAEEQGVLMDQPVEERMDPAESKVNTTNLKRSRDKSAEQLIKRNENDLNENQISLVSRHSVRVYTQVAFTAYLDHSISQLSPGQTIKLDKVLLNDGHAYNQHTGVFTAPITGVYLFNFHVSSYAHYTHVQLMVDDVEQVGAIVSFNGGYENMGGNTATVSVTAGQSVWLEIVESTGELRAYRLCTFTGILLY